MSMIHFPSVSVVSNMNFARLEICFKQIYFLRL